jgi:probable HAF family extracellular repeat protein
VKHTPAAGLAFGLALFLSASRDASAAAFAGVGDLPGGSTYSIATGLSADGSTVVGHSGSASGVEAFRRVSGSTIEGLGDLAGGIFESRANAVSADGSVVVGAGAGSEPSVTQAFRWTAGAQMVALPDFWAGATFWHEATDVTADGAIAAGWNYIPFPPGNQASFGVWLIEGSSLSWEQEAPDDHPLYGQLVAPEVRGISADGGVWAGILAFEAGPKEGVVWSAGGSVLTFIDEGSAGEVHGLSADGETAVGELGGQAYSWTAGGGVVLLGDLPGGSFDSTALDASADGSFVVGYGTTDVGTEAFVWDATNGMRHLGDLLACRGAPAIGWTKLSRGVAISDDAGTVAGYGINPQGDTEAWTADVAFLAASCGGPAKAPATWPGGAAILVGLLIAVGLNAARHRVTQGPMRRE